mmetsp:Transcript_63431/g.139631  ORF Transcript_63431/g.139631 Transcript_63431/m.139631 type:complete len:201 (+) Transcript_63431:3060-3662(+)
MGVLCEVGHWLKLAWQAHRLIEVEGNDEILLHWPEHDIGKDLQRVRAPSELILGLRSAVELRLAPLVAGERALLQQQAAHLRAQQIRDARERQGAVHHEEVNEILQLAAFRPLGLLAAPGRGLFGDVAEHRHPLRPGEALTRRRIAQAQQRLLEGLQYRPAAGPRRCAEDLRRLRCQAHCASTGHVHGLCNLWLELQAAL